MSAFAAGVSPIGVQGAANGSGAIGVQGFALCGVAGDGDECGVRGESYELGVHGKGKYRGIGVFGESERWHGVVGGGRLNGVYGYTTSDDNGVVGQTWSVRPESFGVFAWGAMGCTGPKSAAVPAGRGRYRLVYSMECPECWFEDFGSAKLSRGRANVAIPRDFEPLVRTDGYHVFLTPEGDCNGLYVASKSRKGFEVRELGGGRASIRFSYRIVARRKDVAVRRLPVVKLKEPPKPAREKRAR